MGCLLIAVALVACSNPFSGKTADVAATGRASLSLSFNLGYRTIVPADADIAASIALYGVRLSSAGKADITATANASGTLTLENLVPGTWSVTVQALNYEDQVVAWGTDPAVVVEAGVSRSCTVDLQYDMVNGYGDVEVSVFFPASLMVDAVVATLRSTTTLAIPVAISPLTASDWDEVDEAAKVGSLADPAAWSRIDIVKTRVRAGAPLLTVSFMRKGIVLGTMNERAWIFRNLPTRAYRTLTDAHFGKPPSAPRHLAMTQLSSGAMVVSWDPTSVIADGYDLERSVGMDGSWEVCAKKLDPGIQNWLDADVLPGHSYRYRVKAVNRFGSSPYASGAAAVGAVTPVYLGYWNNDYYGLDMPAYWQGGALKTLDPLESALYYNVTAIDVYNGDVYVAGFYENSWEGYSPVYWVNGKANTVAKPDFVDAMVTGIVVDKAAVHLAGNIDDSWYNKPVYWRNGILYELPTPGSENGVEYTAFNLVSSDGDIYILGVAQDMYYGRGSFPVYWKNGTIVALSRPDSTWYSMNPYTLDMAVANGVVTIVANNLESSGPAYWTISPSGVITGPNYFDLGQAGEAWVTGVAADGNDVYFSGFQSFTPVFWKNGGKPIPLPYNGYYAEAVDIAVRDGDVHIIGWVNNFGHDSIVAWKNGKPVAFPAMATRTWGSCLALPDLPMAATGGDANPGQFTIDTSELLPELTFKDLPDRIIAGLPFSFEPSFQGSSYELLLDGVALPFTMEGGRIKALIPDVGDTRLTLLVTQNGITHVASQTIYVSPVIVSYYDYYDKYYNITPPFYVYDYVYASTNVAGADAYTMTLYYPNDPTQQTPITLYSDPLTPNHFLMDDLWDSGTYTLIVEVTVDGVTVVHTTTFVVEGY
jgi:hypothetical protein